MRVFFILLIASSSITSSHADVLYVDAGAGGNNDGSGWADAFVDLQGAWGRNTGCRGSA